MLLECNHLSYQYPGSGVKVIDKLCFSMHGPGFNAVFGPSGAGKTSFARIIAGQIRAGQGGINTEGIRTILYCCNLERLPGWSSIGKLLGQVTPPGKESLLEELSTVFEMRELMESRFSQLSLGQRNRSNLLRYLIQDFDLLILDESLANVDEKLRQTIIMQVKALFPDRMFLYISHNLMEVAKFCKDILVLGAPSEPRAGSMIQGRDFRRGSIPEKNRLDSTMLEIMNAC